MYSPRYAPYFIDLGDWLPAEHMSHFSSGIATQSCKYKDKWVGLPITYEFNVLYCNTNLLKKHNKKIPKTWNELLEIGKYIRDNDENSNELLLYNGFFPYSEAIVYSTQEFIYSFRNEKNFPYPEYTSREAENALNKLMEIKEELASDEIFMAIEIETFIRLFTGKGLFLKYWYYPINNIPYKIIPLVGNKEGISGSAIGGTNVGINKYIAENQKKLAVDALKYMTSVETQKKLMLNGILKSAIISLYDDPEVCQIIDCELIKSIQPIIRPSNLTNNYDEYSMKFSELIQNFLYKNKTATETLIAIDDIVRFHSFSIINSSTPKIGILIFIISVTTLIIILLTIVLIFIKKYRYHFRFLSIDFWIIILIGLIFHTSIIFTYYGNLSIFKCKLKFILLSLGFSLIFIPFLYKLIVIFQKKFNYKSRIKNHKYLFFLGFILFDIIMIIPIIRVPYKMKENIIHDGKNYLSCIDRSVFGITIKFFSYTEKVLIVLAIIFFLFVEWNILEIVIDIRLITSAVSVDIILYILYFILSFLEFLQIQK
ncbi:periplasmic binding protein-like II [Neocallimastix californiae]|uniref:Periplasmic binding protein-like II n=1 Tax=Neocallimastix californiae TaxID=1754190 RepID=A0A1Y2AZE1_9FUNG|nr:periplasmic binding protein-like II [Neocallimastix californiae]|eukprot:ORY27225.1 periplasmic binding protein-like II [Neocallimastix californiae]